MHVSLRIKCLLKQSYTEADRLHQVNGQYKLKRTHMYFMQVMGQLDQSNTLIDPPKLNGMVESKMWYSFTRLIAGSV